MENWDDIRSEWETTKITLAALAEKHGIKLGTLKNRKSREGWSRNPTKKDATKSGKVATIQQKDTTEKSKGLNEREAETHIRITNLQNGTRLLRSMRCSPGSCQMKQKRSWMQ
ncbi:hypothetical protein RG959_15370 [Domibacillus sp. 8LH]|uniref:hypothetical protein n=1 Tax=Domibacillus sp. 8LH TaxID=3073900 RepID=UPI00317723C5